MIAACLLLCSALSQTVSDATAAGLLAHEMNGVSDSSYLLVRIADVL